MAIKQNQFSVSSTPTHDYMARALKKKTTRAFYQRREKVMIKEIRSAALFRQPFRSMIVTPTPIYIFITTLFFSCHLMFSLMHSNQPLYPYVVCRPTWNITTGELLPVRVCSTFDGKLVPSRTKRLACSIHGSTISTEATTTKAHAAKILAFWWRRAYSMRWGCALETQ